MEYNYISEDVFTVEGLLSAKECEDFIAMAESMGFGEAPINTFRGAEVVKDVRNNTRVILDDARLAKHLWERVRVYVPDVMRGRGSVGLNERFRFYKYEVGEAFRWHRDGSFQRTNGERSLVTAMVYLNEEFAGGQTRFENFVVKPKLGMGLFFPHHELHEGAEVFAGTKYVLRTDVMYGSKVPAPGSISAPASEVVGS